MSKPISPALRQFILLVDRITIFIAKHWLALANGALVVFTGLPVLAPVLMYYGLTGPADVIYGVYHFTCHELAFRTYFLFGAQPFYTMDQLRAAVGVQNEDPFFWSSFVGNVQLGYKVAWCERDVAIYGTILVAGLVFALIRPHLRPISWRVFVILTIPMAIDGFWQLLTSPVYWVPFLPEHESTWLLRGITGALFGLGAVWLTYPYIEQAMVDVHIQARGQHERALSHGPRV